MGYNVLLLALSQALMMTGTSLLVTSSGLVGMELASERALATLPLATQFLATMLTTFPASFLMRRIGRRSGFALGATLGMAGAGLCTLAIHQHLFWLFCLGTGLIGSFNGFGQFYRFAAADAASEAYRSRAISLVMAGGVIAAFSGPNLANWTRETMDVLFGGTYLSLVVVYTAAVLIAAMLNIPKPDAAELRSRGRPLIRIATQPAFLVAAGSAMIGYGVMSLVMTATPLAMHHHAHAFDDTAFVIQWHVLAMFAPSFVTGHLIRRFGVLTIMVLGAGFMVGCVALNLGGTSVWHFWSALVLLGLGWNFLYIGGTTLLTETYRPEEKAKAQALNDFMVFATVTLSSLTAGVLQHGLGWTWVNLGVLPLLVLTLGALLWLRHRRGTRAAVTCAGPGGP